MKSAEHAVVGAAVSVPAALVVFPDAGTAVLAGVVLGGVLLSVFVDLDHFVVARGVTGDWHNLARAVRNPRVGLVEQEKVFADIDGGLRRRRLFSHHLVGGVLTLSLVLAGVGRLAVFVAVVLYAHVCCDYLRDLDYA
ncbi:hypothetical protein [Halogeometricum limi]|uniref:LexA-binding, inner membrane-associated hydrolase n=1 Tax=Halogeometricum limi TaxID=555875 RepID=A0A1I6GTH5_9EURY|nr:hypothetical protein [Halogeometricum limi]SFR45512.1 hypothetical protein SAMN04488124_1513 [Halogeometricum limi]